MASVLRVPELRLEEEEAARLAAASQQVLAQYDVAVSPKAQAWIGLAMAAGAVYAPHVAAYGLRRGADKMERQRAPQAAQETPAKNGLFNRPRPNGAKPAAAEAPLFSMNVAPGVIDGEDGLGVFSPHLPNGGLN